MSIFTGVLSRIFSRKSCGRGRSCPPSGPLPRIWGISTITVESAYAQLVAEGFLYTLPKRGYYVCELEREEPVAPLPPRPKGPAPREPDKRAYWAILWAVPWPGICFPSLCG